jgi:hypothetical protein
MGSLALAFCSDVFPVRSIVRNEPRFFPIQCVGNAHDPVRLVTNKISINTSTALLTNRSELSLIQAGAFQPQT